MLEADEQDSLELHPPRAGETHPHKITVTNSTDFRSVLKMMYVCGCESQMKPQQLPDIKLYTL